MWKGDMTMPQLYQGLGEDAEPSPRDLPFITGDSPLPPQGLDQWGIGKPRPPGADFVVLVSRPRLGVWEASSHFLWGPRSPAPWGNGTQ